tara:strand:+ start:2914 stop:3276 length:363 start_codon:yes stop_codon:yes gene_type:complete
MKTSADRQLQQDERRHATTDVQQGDFPGCHPLEIEQGKPDRRCQEGCLQRQGDQDHEPYQRRLVDHAETGDVDAKAGRGNHLSDQFIAVSSFSATPDSPGISPMQMNIGRATRTVFDMVA